MSDKEKRKTISGLKYLYVKHLLDGDYGKSFVIKKNIEAIESDSKNYYEVNVKKDSEFRS